VVQAEEGDLLRHGVGEAKALQGREGGLRRDLGVAVEVDPPPLIHRPGGGLSGIVEEGGEPKKNEVRSFEGRQAQLREPRGAAVQGLHRLQRVLQRVGVVVLVLAQAVEGAQLRQEQEQHPRPVHPPEGPSGGRAPEEFLHLSLEPLGGGVEEPLGVLRQGPFRGPLQAEVRKLGQEAEGPQDPHRVPDQGLLRDHPEDLSPEVAEAAGGVQEVAGGEVQPQRVEGEIPPLEVFLRGASLEAREVQEALFVRDSVGGGGLLAQGHHPAPQALGGLRGQGVRLLAGQVQVLGPKAQGRVPKGAAHQPGSTALPPVREEGPEGGVAEKGVPEPVLHRTPPRGVYPPPRPGTTRRALPLFLRASRGRKGPPAGGSTARPFHFPAGEDGPGGGGIFLPLTGEGRGGYIETVSTGLVQQEGNFQGWGRGDDSPARSAFP